MQADAMKNETRELMLGLVPHLVELHHRLQVCVLATVVGFAFGLLMAVPFMRDIVRPAIESGLVLETEAPTEFIQILFRVSLFAGFVLVFPVWCYQAFRFVVPGLTDRERRLARRLFFLVYPIGVLVFFAGAGLALTYVLPGCVRMLKKTGMAGVTNSWQLGAYLRFTLRFSLAAGLLPEIPLLAATLGWIGLKISAVKRLAVAVVIVVGILLVDFVLAVGQMGIVLGVLALFALLGPLQLAKLYQRARYYARRVMGFVNQYRLSADQFVDQVLNETD